MEREIRFRGKTRKGEWVYGELVRCVNYASILSREYIEYNPLDRIGDAVLNNLVDEDTIGQYTGLKDVDGTEIYEQDIVEVPSFEEKNERFPRKFVRGAVKFIDGSFVAEYSNNQRVAIHELVGRIKVVGNLFKND